MLIPTYIPSRNILSTLQQWELYNPDKVRFYEYTSNRQGTGAAGGSCTVSCQPHHDHPIATQWRACTARRGRGKIDILSPPADSIKSYPKTRKCGRTPKNYISPSKAGLKMLELCSGSGVLSKAFRLQGVQTTTLDHDPSKEADHIISLKQLREAIDKDTLPAGLDVDMDIVHAAPCCRTWSKGGGGSHRDKHNVEGFSPCSKKANKEIEDLIKVLEYYQRRNPVVLILIENPEGYLQKSKYSDQFINEKKLGLELVRVSYCKFAGGYEEEKRIILPRKNTCLWTNSESLLFNFANVS